MEELNAIYERMRTIFSEEAGFVPNDGCDAMVRLYALASEVQAVRAMWMCRRSLWRRGRTEMPSRGRSI